MYLQICISNPEFAMWKIEIILGVRQRKNSPSTCFIFFIGKEVVSWNRHCLTYHSLLSSDIIVSNYWIRAWNLYAQSRRNNCHIFAQVHTLQSVRWAALLEWTISVEKNVKWLYHLIRKIRDMSLPRDIRVWYIQALYCISKKYSWDINCACYMSFSH